MKPSNDLLRGMAFSLIVSLSVPSFVEASFFNFTPNNSSMTSDSKLSTSGTSFTGTSDTSLSSNGNSSNTNMYVSAEPGRIEYCFHQDVNIAGHKFSIDSHGVAGKDGFSNSTSSSADGNSGSLNINDDDDSNCNTGNISGVVYLDSNLNGQQDAGEVGAKDIEVQVTDEEENVVTVKTDDNGEYQVTNILEGTVSVLVKTETLPDGGTLVTPNDNPTEVVVEANEETDAGKDGYTLPAPVGSACGYVYVNDAAQEDVTVNLTDTEDTVHTEVSDAEGKYCFTDIPEGSATVDIDDSTLPSGAELTSGEDPNNVNIVSDTENDAGTDKYTVEEDEPEEP